MKINKQSVKFMRKLTFLLACFLLVSVGWANAQSTSVSGKVVSAENGDPIVGATVLVKGTNTGTITGNDGEFTITVPSSSSVLVVSFIGTATVELVAQNGVVVRLEALSSELDEVVVVGYGTARRSSLTGSIATVGNKDISDVPIANASQALQGKATGVQVLASTGRPGSAAIIKVRGVGSINAGSEPLYVIDGVPMSASDFSTLNSNDIENISVLKDASATAIYGSRGSNGVVLVTTRRGERGKSTITAKAQYGITNRTFGSSNLMNAQEKLTYEKQLGIGLGTTLTDEEISNYSVNTDWADVVFRTGITQIYEVSVQGGNDDGRYYVSGQYYDQEAIVPGSYFDKISARVNLDQKIREYLKFGINLNGGTSKEGLLRTDRNALNPFNYVYSANPYVNPYNDDGSYNTSLSLPSGLNILENIENNPSHISFLRVIGSTFLEWEIIDGLKFKTTGGVNYAQSVRYQYNKPESGLSEILGDPYGYRRDAFASSRTLLWTNTLTYDKTFADIHNIKLIGGTETVKNDYKEFAAMVSGFATGKVDAIDSGSSPESPSGTEEAWRLVSFFGSGHYVFDEKYFADLSLRTDGSSRFGVDNQFGTFWAVGAGWNLKKESFLSDVDFINNLKLRGSTGLSGNNNIGNYAAQGVFAYGSYNAASTSYPARLPNPNLSWEKSLQTSIGIDLTVLDERINFTADVYQRNTSDLLLDRQLSRTSGFSSRIENVGELENKGIELSLSGYVVKNRELSVELYANTSYNTNKIIELYGGEDIDYGWNNILKEGYPIFNYKMVRWAGVNPTNGDALYYDKDGKITATYNADDAVLLDGVTPLPIYYGSFGLNASYKGFDLKVDMYYSYGNYIYNHTLYSILSDGSGAANKNVDRSLLYDQWKNPGDVTNVPRQSPSNSANMSTRYLEDASYLRLRNLTLAYSLPKRIAENINLNSLRLFVTGNNLLTFTGFTGFDPEIGDSPYGTGTGPQGGVLDYSYPASRTLMFGVEVSL